MTDQLILDFPVETAFGREDYFVSDANRLAVAQVRDWNAWVNGRLVLNGPEGSGKSHLLSVWAEEVGAERLSGQDVGYWQPKAFARAIAIDDLPADVDQTALFLLLNQMRAEGRPVMIAVHRPISVLGLDLADLVSRLEASSLTSLKAVDDMLLQAIFLKQVLDRQLQIAPDIPGFALARIERSPLMIKKLVAKMDQLSLQHKKAVTKRLVSAAISAVGEEA